MSKNSNIGKKVKLVEQFRGRTGTLPVGTVLRIVGQNGPILMLMRDGDTTKYVCSFMKTVFINNRMVGCDE